MEDDQLASQHPDINTHQTKQSPTITGDCSRYVGVPPIPNNAQIRTPSNLGFKPTHTALREEEQDHPHHGLQEDVDHPNHHGQPQLIQKEDSQDHRQPSKEEPNQPKVSRRAVPTPPIITTPRMKPFPASHTAGRPGLTPQRKRKATEAINQTLEKTPKKNCQPQSQITPRNKPLPELSQPPRICQPKSQEWLEFTRVGGKMILMKTIDIGQAKSTRKRKCTKHTPQTTNANPMPTPHPPTHQHQPTTPRSGQCRQKKVAIKTEEYQSPRQTYLKNKPQRKPGPEEEMERVRNKLRRPPSSSSRKPSSPSSSPTTSSSSSKLSATPHSISQCETSEGSLSGKENSTRNEKLKILKNIFEKSEPYVNHSKPERKIETSQGGKPRNTVVCKPSEQSIKFKNPHNQNIFKISDWLTKPITSSAAQPMGGIIEEESEIVFGVKTKDNNP